MLQISKLLRRSEASTYLKDKWGVDRAMSTLAKLAVTGGGPPFQRLGRIPLYAADDLDEWVASKLSGRMRSTSDTAAPKNKIAQILLGKERGASDNETISEGA
jgi:hypothetical protein